MHRKRLEPPYDPVGEAVLITVHSTKGRAKFFHGAYASRAEAESFARAITLPPYDHDTAVVRQSRACAEDRRQKRTDYSFKPVLVTVNGQPTKDFRAAHELKPSDEVNLDE